MKDQRAIKGKLDQNGIRPSWSLILGEVHTLKKKKKRKKRRRRGSQERFGYLFGFAMVLFEFALGFLWILVCSIFRV